jgi:hypothetical protein
MSDRDQRQSKEALMFRRAMAIGVVVCALVIVFAGVTSAQDKAAQAAAKAALDAVAGKYEGTASTPNGDMAIVCELRVENGNIVGTFGAGDFQIAVTSGTLVGDKLTLNLDMNGNPMAITGTLKDGHFEGQGSMGGAIVMTRVGATPAPAPAAKPPAPATPPPSAAPPAAANAADPISGDWDGLVDTPDQQRAITLRLKLDSGKVSGEIGSEMGTVTLQSGTWADGNLTMAFPFQSGDLITMVAKIQDGKLVGTLSIGDQMTVAWVAVKKK